MTRSRNLLVVAGEASGDAMAAPVVARLGIPAFGLGGTALRKAGVELAVDLSSLTAMGVGAVLARSPAIARAALAVAHETRKRRPSAALLVGYSEFNAWFGPWLRARGIRVLWYGPPQIWAWRLGRADSIRAACDRMAVILPFEQVLWRQRGVDAHYVGHPALEHPPPARASVRERFGLTPYAEYLALLPGSRPHEVRMHLQPMLEAVGLIRAERGAVDARVVIAPSLDAKTSAFATRTAAGAGLSVLETSAPTVLPAFDVAVAASGTVTLECAVAGVPPVIVYRTGKLTHFIAKRLVTTPCIGLPNIVLGRAVFPELVQERMTAQAIAEEATRLLENRPEYVERCREVRGELLSTLSPAQGNGHSVSHAKLGERPSERVARLLAPWLL